MDPPEALQERTWHSTRCTSFLNLDPSHSLKSIELPLTFVAVGWKRLNYSEWLKRPAGLQKKKAWIWDLSSIWKCENVESGSNVQQVIKNEHCWNGTPCLLTNMSKINIYFYYIRLLAIYYYCLPVRVNALQGSEKSWESFCRTENCRNNKSH